ncbi:EspF repeat-containing protein [Salinarchaeum sp. Harcht-Bsk1]
MPAAPLWPGPQSPVSGEQSVKPLPLLVINHDGTVHRGRAAHRRVPRG